MKNLHEMYIGELHDLYDAESQVLKALEKMESEATNKDLKAGFAQHRTQTRTHLERLGEILRSHGEAVKGKPCKGMKGIIAEGEDHVSEAEDPMVRDAVLIASAQKVEHYEICSYGTLRALAEEMGHTADVKLIDKSIDEEYDTDRKLSALADGRSAEAGLNKKAMENGLKTKAASR